MKPDYTNSIVNLSCTIAQSFGIECEYPALNSNALDELEQTKNIILLLVDGLGYNYLKENATSTLLRKHLSDSLTSVFLPSTGSAITSIMSGVAPQQHGVTGWFVYLREYGIVSRILPYSNTIDYNLIGSDIANIVTTKSIYEPLGDDYSLILPEQIVNSVFTRNLAESANRIRYAGLDDFFTQVEKRVSQSRSTNFIYGYWPGFDAIAHLLGFRSKEAAQQLTDFDGHLKTFIQNIQGTDTKVIITGDHGFDDVPSSNMIYTKDHTRFEECLLLPLCGDTRSVYAYVRPQKVNEFERYVRNAFEDVCDLYPSKDLIEEGWFGLYTPHPRLDTRVGDYTLIFKEGHAILNCFPGFNPPNLIGHHGGASPNEMIVPLCVIDC